MPVLLLEITIHDHAVVVIYIHITSASKFSGIYLHNTKLNATVTKLLLCEHYASQIMLVIVLPVTHIRKYWW